MPEAENDSFLAEDCFIASNKTQNYNMQKRIISTENGPQKLPQNSAPLVYNMIYNE